MSPAPPLKVSRAFQNNGPDYFVVLAGRCTFVRGRILHGRELARFATEPEALAFVQGYLSATHPAIGEEVAL